MSKVSIPLKNPGEDMFLKLYFICDCQKGAIYVWRSEDFESLCTMGENSTTVLVYPVGETFLASNGLLKTYKLPLAPRDDLCKYN